MPLLRNFTTLVRTLQLALERRIQANHQELGLQQSRFLVRAIIWTLLGASGAGLAWLALAKTDEVVIAPGTLQPVGNVKIVQMPAGGVLDELLVREGERVKKGQVLMRLDNEATVDREVSIREGISAKQQQLRLKQLELQRYLNLNDTEQESLQGNLELQLKILRRLESLKSSGAVSELQVLQQNNEVSELQGDLKKAQVDRLRQTVIVQQQIQQLNGELAEMRSNLTELSVNLRYQDLRSPVDGVVFDLKPKGPGFVAQTSEPVMKIVPFSDLQAKVEINSSDIGFVRLGKPVDLSIDSFPSTDFGVLAGRLSSIGSDALPPDERHKDYRFPAVISLESQRFKLRSGQELPLQVGMSLTANIKLRKVSYLQLLLGGLQDKASALRRI